jgi:hypothetical protein
VDGVEGSEPAPLDCSLEVLGAAAFVATAGKWEVVLLV